MKSIYATTRGAIAQSRAALDAALPSAGSGSGSEAQSDGQSASQVGTELFAVVATMDAERQLRSGLTDSSVPAQVRAGLAQQVFGGKISAPALTTVKAAASQNWSRTSDFGDALAGLGYEALLRAAGTRLGEVEDELFRLARIIADSTELERAFSDRGTSTDAKAALMDSLIVGKTTEITRALARQAARRPQTGVVPELDALSDLAAAQREQIVAHVRSAAELSTDERAKLAESLQRSYGKPVQVHVEVDASLLSGFVVHIGDDVIDGSAAGRLAELRQAFK